MPHSLSKMFPLMHRTQPNGHEAPSSEPPLAPVDFDTVDVTHLLYASAKLLGMAGIILEHQTPGPRIQHLQACVERAQKALKEARQGEESADA